jgi:pimeloyl-CoA synthetase
MAYYNKKEVEEIVLKENKEVEKKGLKPLTPIEHTIMQLKNEEDIVGFFWINISEGENLDMRSKAFVRVDHDLYTDDRFALDVYQAQKDGKSVSDIIFSRIKNVNDKPEKNVDDKDAIKK